MVDANVVKVDIQHRYTARLQHEFAAVVRNKATHGNGDGKRDTKNCPSSPARHDYTVTLRDEKPHHWRVLVSVDSFKIELDINFPEGYPFVPPTVLICPSSLLLKHDKIDIDDQGRMRWFPGSNSWSPSKSMVDVLNSIFLVLHEAARQQEQKVE